MEIDLTLYKGYVYKSSRGEAYFANFYNPLIKKYEYLGSGCLKDVLKKYSEKQISFYSKHKYLLPKRISITNDRKFKFEFSILMKSKNKTVFVGSFDTLEEAIESKENTILSLI